jgi:hypothetical protein
MACVHTRTPEYVNEVIITKHSNGKVISELYKGE